MQVHFLRHATSLITIQGLNLLLDPMLSPAGAMDAIANAASDARFPLVGLPLGDGELEDMLKDIDAALVTHLHRDHWDSRALELLSKDVPVFCQPVDEAAIKEQGFTSVMPVSTMLEWRGIRLHRTRGRHGKGEIGQKMGAVSGFVLRADREPTLYIAGDTIWCEDVEDALRTYQPDAVILNAGGAQFLMGDPITMTADDVIRVCRALVDASVIAVHMDTVNHCLVTRAMLRDTLREAGLEGQVHIPADGEKIPLELDAMKKKV
jgi:L-ascorbate metabolism protein UlaG (beta-lactamase superfamily)